MAFRRKRRRCQDARRRLRRGPGRKRRPDRQGFGGAGFRPSVARRFVGSFVVRDAIRARLNAERREDTIREAAGKGALPVRRSGARRQNRHFRQGCPWRKHRRVASRLPRTRLFSPRPCNLRGLSTFQTNQTGFSRVAWNLLKRSLSIAREGRPWGAIVSATSSAVTFSREEVQCEFVERFPGLASCFWPPSRCARRFPARHRTGQASPPPPRRRRPCSRRLAHPRPRRRRHPQPPQRRRRHPQPPQRRRRHQRSTRGIPPGCSPAPPWSL
jgi:hypothetical protein